MGWGAGNDDGGTALPSGIVTFVFTDIEQSTRLLRRLGDRYGELLDRHFALMREAWLAHGGHEIDHAGDSTFVVFGEAEEAVAACAEAQRLLGTEPWPPEDPVRVRMGVHTGLASPRGSNYVALAVHQAARVMSVGHGGQVLVSADTAGHLGSVPGIELVAIGRYRLRDFDGPAPLYQVAGDGLASSFPAVRAVPADGHNFVAPPTPFLGRSAEAKDVASLIGSRRIVTLTGPGGVGKSRLAMEVGLRVADAWDDGVWLVDLAPLHDPAQVATAVAAAVGAPKRRDDRWEDVVEHLAKGSALVVLDCCEHLASTAASVAAALTDACPGCGVLATSREPLGVTGEIVRKIDPLPRDDAIALFLDRAAAVTSDVAPMSGAGDTIAAICDRLDGLPLAIELAAARLGALSLQQVHAGLDDRFRLLRSRNVTVPERQRTMQALLEWSDRLLAGDERTCLRRLGVFGGNFTLDSATACASGDGVAAPDVPELVYSLVDKSLVIADLAADGSRYLLLDSVRAYARQQLGDDTRPTALRLARWYLDWIGPACRSKSGWTSDTGAEIANLRALIPLIPRDDVSVAQELAITIGRHHDAITSHREGVAEVTRLVEQLSEPTPELVSLLACLGDLHLRTGDVAGAEEILARAERVRDEVGAVPAWDDVAIERTRLEIESRRGNFDRTIEIAKDTLTRTLSTRGAARINSALGVAAVAVGDFDTALAACEQELDAYVELDDEAYQASAHGNLAEIALRRGDATAAAHHQKACLDLALALGSKGMVAFSLIVAARLSAQRHEWRTAATLHAHAEQLLEAVGLALYDYDREVSNEMLAAAEDRLGRDEFVGASAAGVALDLPAAAVLARDVLTAVEVEP